MVSMIWEFLIRNCSLIVSGAIGTLGFCLFFRIRRDKLIYGCIGGLLTSLFYCICSDLGMSILMRNLVPAIVGTLYAEIIARIVKAPATVFLIPAVIPLTPGGTLYYERYCRWRYGKGTGTGWNHASGGTGHCRGNCVYFRYFLSVDQLEQTAKGYEEQALATGVRKAW